MTELVNKVKWGAMYTFPLNELRFWEDRFNSEYPHDQHYFQYVPVYIPESDKVWMIDTYHIKNEHRIVKDDVEFYLNKFANDFRKDGSYALSHARCEYYYSGCFELSEQRLEQAKIICDLHDYTEIEDYRSMDEYNMEDVIRHARFSHEYKYPDGITLIKKDAKKRPEKVLKHKLKKLIGEQRFPWTSALLDMELEKIKSELNVHPDYLDNYDKYNLELLSELRNIMEIWRDKEEAAAKKWLRKENE